MITFCSLIMALALSSLIAFSYFSPRRGEEDDRYSQIRDTWMPIITFTWQFFIGIAVLFNVLFGVSSTTNTLILVHGLVEVFMMVALILLYRNTTISTGLAQRFVFFYLVATILIFILFTTAGNVHAQAVLVIIAAVPDIGIPL